MIEASLVMRRHSVNGSKCSFSDWFSLMVLAVLLPAGEASSAEVKSPSIMGEQREPARDLIFVCTYPKVLVVHLSALVRSQPLPEVLEPDLVMVLADHQVKQDNQQLTSKTGSKQNSQAEEADRLNQEGLKLTNQAKYLEALERFEQSLVIFEEIGDRRGGGEALNNIGLIYNILGEYPKALDFYKQSLVIIEEIDERYGIGA